MCPILKYKWRLWFYMKKLFTQLHFAAHKTLWYVVIIVLGILIGVSVILLSIEYFKKNTHSIVINFSDAPEVVDGYSVSQTSSSRSVTNTPHIAILPTDVRSQSVIQETFAQLSHYNPDMVVFLYKGDDTDTFYTISDDSGVDGFTFSLPESYVTYMPLGAANQKLATMFAPLMTEYLPSAQAMHIEIAPRSNAHVLDQLREQIIQNTNKKIAVIAFLPLSDTSLPTYTYDFIHATDVAQVFSTLDDTAQRGCVQCYYLVRSVADQFDMLAQVVPNQSSIVSSIVFQTSTHTNILDTQIATLLFSGDVMLGRHVETLMRARGTSYPFQKVATFLAEPDAVIINLEGPIPTTHRQTPNFSTHFSFDPKLVESLVTAHITRVSLANNHTYDYGSEGYAHTTSTLRELGIRYFGHPRVEDHAVTVMYDTIRGQEIAYIGFHATQNSFDVQKAIAVVARERANHPDIFIIPVIHWGAEYRLTSIPFQQNLAHGLIDAGADVIIGHHPHVVEEVELYKNKPIFYSLGNFVFDQYFSTDVEQGLLVGMVITPEKVTYHIFPLHSTASVPMLMSEDARTAFLRGLADRSSDMIASQVADGILQVDR